MLPRATKHFHGAYGATWLFLKKSATSLNLKVQRNSEKSPGNLSPLTSLNFPEPPIPKNKVSDPISDQEMAFARLVLSRAMTDRHAAKAVGLQPNSAAIRIAPRPPASPPSPGYLPLRLRLELPFPTRTPLSWQVARWHVLHGSGVYPSCVCVRECATYFGVAIGRRKTFWLCLDQQTAEAVPAPDFSEAAEK